jgi:hypothetical protein
MCVGCTSVVLIGKKESKKSISKNTKYQANKKKRADQKQRPARLVTVAAPLCDVSIQSSTDGRWKWKYGRPK